MRGDNDFGHNDNPFGGDARRFEEQLRRGFRRMAGFGRFADWGQGIGNSVRVGRMLASGDVRLVALFFIEQQPRHGYDLIKAIEERSNGFYSPSPGMVYPALTFLEEAGYVTAEADGNKKLYTITEAGRGHLSENREAIDQTLSFLGKAGERFRAFREGGGDHEGPHHHHRGPRRHEREAGRDRDIRNAVPELNEARRELKAAIAEALNLGEDEQRRVADILNRAAGDIRNARPTGADDIDL